MSKRKPITRVVTRKRGYSVVRYGRVQFHHKDLDAIEAFLRGFDPELAARREFVRSGRAAEIMRRLLADEA